MSRSDRHSGKRFFVSAALIPLLVIVFFMSFFPLLLAFRDSFMHDIYGEKRFAGLENYGFLFSDAGFWYSLLITVLWAVCCTVAVMFVGLSTALLLFRNRGYSRWLPYLLFVPWGIPAYIAVPIWRALIHGNAGNSIFSLITGLQINLLTDPAGAFFATVWVSVWMNLPFTAFILLGQLKKIPQEILDAGKMDGASFRTLISEILVPLIRPGILTMVVLNLLKFLKDFTVIFLMTSGGPPMTQLITNRSILGATTTAEVFLFEAFQNQRDLGIPAAFSFVMGLIIFCIMLIWFRVQKNPLENHRKTLSWQPRRIPMAGTVANTWLKLWKPRQTQWPRLLFTTVFYYGNHFLLFLLVAGTILCLYALVWMSFSAVNTTYIHTFVPQFFTPTNFRRLFFEEDILRYFGNSLLLSIASALLVPIITFAAAFALTRLSVKKQAGILTVVNLSAALSGMHSLIPLFVFFRSVRLTDTYIPLILIYLCHSIPFSLFTMKSFLENFPSSFYDQAKLEGMRAMGYVTRILFPLSLAPIVTSIMYGFLNAWNGFLAPMIFLNDDKSYPISVKLYSYVGNVASGNPQWGLFSAASIINLAIIFLLFIPLKKPLFQATLSESIDF